MTKTTNSLTLNTRINVPVLLTLTSGIISTTSVNLLVMNNAANTTIGNATSYIDGPMYYDMAFNGNRTLNLPIGKGPDWRPAIISVTHNNATSYTYNSEVFNASAQGLGWTLAPTVTRVSFVHYWDINRQLTSTGVAAPNTNLTGNQIISLYYDNNDGVGDPANLVVCKNTTAGPTTWINIGGAGATTSVGVVASTSAPSPFNSFSRFTLGNGTGGVNILPIELVSFTAKPVDDFVALNWVTASEKNNDCFNVEKSKDGVTFEQVVNVKAGNGGNYAGIQNYQAKDLSPYSGLSYYRLQQKDKSGAISYAPIVAVNTLGDAAIEVYPNPAKNKLTIKFHPAYSNMEISIIGTLGNTVVAPIRLGAINGSLDVSSLTPGLYYLVSNNAEAMSPIKIVIE